MIEQTAATKIRIRYTSHWGKSIPSTEEAKDAARKATQHQINKEAALTKAFAGFRRPPTVAKQNVTHNMAKATEQTRIFNPPVTIDELRSIPPFKKAI